MIDIRESIVVGGKEYQEVVRYFVVEHPDLRWMGFIDILDGDKVIFHHNLMMRPYKEFASKTPEERLSLVLDELRSVVGDPVLPEIEERIKTYEHAVNNGYVESYSFTDRFQDDIETVKANLIRGMNALCEKKIEEGFYSGATGRSCLYRFNKNEDQLNFNQQVSMMILVPSINEVFWKTENFGIVRHTREQFFAVIGDAAIAKQSKINHYWALKDYIEKAETLEELKNVSWDFKIPQAVSPKLEEKTHEETHETHPEE